MVGFSNWPGNRKSRFPDTDVASLLKLVVTFLALSMVMLLSAGDGVSNKTMYSYGDTEHAYGFSSSPAVTAVFILKEGCLLVGYALTD